MLVTNFQAQAFATNCWILSTGRGRECIVVDPGMPNVSEELAEKLREFDLKPVAVLVTHGHLDHTFSVQPICDGYEIPAMIHSDDRELLLHPERAHGAEFIAQLSGIKWEEPREIVELKDNQNFELVGLKFRAIHSPGHTKGSVMFEVNSEILISGDVLFAGSIGRTDLPGGSWSAMQKSLREKVLPLPDVMQVLPGHGPETSIGRERKYNQFLQNL
ncbi:MAG: MBL fold metallo-hydrolase [Candidatus Nanopelagicaceae bacterium]|jgi:glyoxylase-like metal-dependent hydrolase (beta-lactamase superfamily II)